MSKYALSIVGDSRERMSKFISGFSEIGSERVSYNYAWIFFFSWFMPNRFVENLKERSWETKRARTNGGNFSYFRSGGRGCSRFRQMFSCQCSSNIPPRSNNERVINVKPQRENGNGSLLLTYAGYGNKHEGKCLADTDGCFSFGKNGHKIRDFPMIMAKDREGKQTLLSGSGSNDPKQNRFYAT